MYRLLYKKLDREDDLYTHIFTKPEKLNYENYVINHVDSVFGYISGDKNCAQILKCECINIILYRIFNLSEYFIERSIIKTYNFTLTQKLLSSLIDKYVKDMGELGGCRNGAIFDYSGHIVSCLENLYLNGNWK
jgi:hypothetical protein